jgi:hypothetical protein
MDGSTRISHMVGSARKWLSQHILLLALVAIQSNCGQALESDSLFHAQQGLVVASASFTIPEGQSTWLDTGIDVIAGDRVVLTGGGSIWAGVWFTAWNDADGWADSANDSKYPVTTRDDPRARAFGLVGSFGLWEKFQIGKGVTKIASGSRRLYLRTNDDSPGNGRGAFTCHVLVERGPAPPLKVGLYFIDGSTLDGRTGAESIIYKMHKAAGRTLKNTYLPGPDVMCDSCERTTLSLVSSICADLRSGEVTKAAVFGYSRGAIMVNHAMWVASAGGCPEQFVDGDVSNRYFFGGFDDAVETIIWTYKKDIPSTVPWLHVYKVNASEGALGVLNTQYFKGSGGVNQPYTENPSLKHVEIGFETGVQLKLMKKANQVATAAGVSPLFPGY